MKEMGSFAAFAIVAAGVLATAASDAARTHPNPAITSAGKIDRSCPRIIDDVLLLLKSIIICVTLSPAPPTPHTTNPPGHFFLQLLPAVVTNLRLPTAREAPSCCTSCFVIYWLAGLVFVFD